MDVSPTWASEITTQRDVEVREWRSRRLEAVSLKARVQLRHVHLVRAALRYASTSDRREIAADVKKIYSADRPDPEVHSQSQTVPHRDSALKMISMAIDEASKQRTKALRNWKQALNHFAIMSEIRLPKDR